MRQTVRRVIQIVLLCVFVFSAVQVVKTMLEYRKGDKIYEEAQILTGKAERIAEDIDNPIDFSELQKINPEIFGWITIEDTPVDYPLLQGKDNEYYLTRAYNREFSGFGSIFLDIENQVNLSDRHTILYGHNMKNKAMFGSLSQYKKPEYAKDHDEIKIYLPDRVLTYQIFSAYTAHVLDDVYRLQFPDDASFQAMLDEMMTHCVVELEEKPTTKDTVLTLSTCTPAGDVNYRFVVNAVLIEDSGEEKE